MKLRATAAALMLVLSVPAAAAGGEKLIVLGVDGLDPNLLDRFIEEGALPNFAKLIDEGDYKPLQTTMPPQSPVAWSTFITGMDPGGHGIYDFVHRDPATMHPYMSMSRATPSEKQIALGNWVLPLEGGEVEQLRKGTAFWQILEERGVPTTVFRIPANFPPVPSPGRSFSGMGTPDLRGTPGTFSFYTSSPPSDLKVSGGKIYPVEIDNHKIEAQLIGPTNPFRRETVETDEDKEPQYRQPDTTVDFTVYRDPREGAARFVVQDHDFILSEGEWSDWKEVQFDAVPYLVGFSGLARFYLQEAHPEFRLYVSPIQINPKDPIMPVSTPEDWGHHLCEQLGFFYTQELPEDTKALSAGIFSTPEFHRQASIVYDERRHALDHLVEEFNASERGLLFFYFSSSDQQAHMLWRNVDREHPGFEDIPTLSDSIKQIYMKIDDAIGHVMETMAPETTLVIMSDHGFAPFYWGVNLNSWLVEKGYVTLKNPRRQGRYPYFANVDWSKTEAYALGLNAVYVNLKGREKNGIVEPEDYDKVLDRLERDLLEFRDAERGGRQVVTLVTRPRRDFHGPYADKEADLLVGYNRGYRSSWKSPLGEFPREIIVENTEAWSGDHTIDYRIVPGVLITNKAITLDKPALYDLTVAVLDEFGIEPLPEMIGRDCLGEPASRLAARSLQTSAP